MSAPIDTPTAPILLPVKNNGQPRPLVSVVMPTYRRASLIGESIRSVLEQTLDNLELLIQDDCSPDNTAEVVAQFQDPRIRYARNERTLKMPDNLNAGIRRSTGSYVMVCHDHDLYHPSLLKKMVQFLQVHQTATFVHTAVSVIDQSGRETGQSFIGDYVPLTAGWTWLDFMLSRFDSPVTANSMVSRRTYEAYGLYDPALGFISDVEMWMRLCLHGDVGYVAEPLIQVRSREEGHEYTDVRWDIVDSILQIHRRYHSLAYTGWSRLWQSLALWTRQERYLIRSFLICIKRRDPKSIAEGCTYLRQSNGFLSRIISHIPRM